MIDISKAKWELSKEEKFAVKWFEAHGFSGELTKQFLSKTVFTVSKDGISDTMELMQGFEGINIAKYMEQYMNSFSLKRELIKLRKQAGALTP